MIWSSAYNSWYFFCSLYGQEELKKINSTENPDMVDKITSSWQEEYLRDLLTQNTQVRDLLNKLPKSTLLFVHNVRALQIDRRKNWSQ